MAGRMPRRGPRKPSQVKNMQELLRLINQQRTSMGLPPVETTTPPPRPRINSSEQPPFPVGLEDPTKALRDQSLFHGSNSLGYVMLPEGQTWKDYPQGYPVPPGTDLAGFLDPKKASVSGHLGPAVLYTTNNRGRASAFGSLYQPIINADYSDFIGLNRQAMRPDGGQFAKVQASPSLLRNLRDSYGERTGRPMPPDITLSRFNEHVALPAITQSLLDSNVDLETLNPLIQKMHAERNYFPQNLQQIAFNEHGYAPSWLDEYLSGPGGLTRDNYSYAELHNAHAAGRKAIQDSIVESGAAGLTERYPNDPDTGRPQQHFAVYNKNAIESLIKMGLMLGAMKAGSGTEE